MKYLKQRINSLGYAINGLKILFKEEANARIHLFAGFLVITSGFYFKLNTNEWVAILLSIGFVLSMEILNTSIENVADFISPDKHSRIKIIKDLGAASVLINALTALLVGIIIFYPKINSFL